MKHTDTTTNESVAGAATDWSPAAAATRALVIAPVLPSPRNSLERGEEGSGMRDPEARLAEAIGLAQAIDLDVVSSGVVRAIPPRPATLMGKGKVEELAGLVRAEEIELVVVDSPLSPAQQRNLERAWKTKVLDRTGLILEIFGARARTREGRLQVELAHLNWQKSRLVRSWTHLERQRGGYGFLGGPGETQIETDRRMIQERIVRIEKDLESVRRMRELHRESRRRVPYPIVAIVGYTNAGKSTLFNRLTRSEVLAEDLLFATLDPTLRGLRLPQGRTIILSDTVGFISDLPTHLVAAFRATLEEVVEADVILHVRDISHGDREAQATDVVSILGSLGVDVETSGRVLEVWNKIDLLPSHERAELDNRVARMAPHERPVLASAAMGEGMDAVLDAIALRLNTEGRRRLVHVDPTDGASLNWLYERCEVLSRRDDDRTGEAHVEVHVPDRRLGEFAKRFPDAESVAAAS